MMIESMEYIEHIKSGAHVLPSAAKTSSSSARLCFVDLSDVRTYSTNSGQWTEGAGYGMGIELWDCESNRAPCLEEEDK